MKWFRTLACVSLSAAAWQAHAAWPEQPLTIVVPYSPGAMGDNIARLLSNEMAETLGTPVIVDNRPGAGGNIGAHAVANADPDGYTIMMSATNNLVLNQFLYDNLGYDPLEAFEPIIMVADVPAVIFANQDLPIQTYAEFRELARQNPGKYNFASPGAGTTPHLSAQAISEAEGMGMVHVPYGGAGPAVQALLAGDVHFYMGGAGLGAPHVKAGNMKALAVASNERVSALPDVPTFTEAGITEVLANNWWALAAPAGTPDDVIEKINAAVQQALETPEVQERFNQFGVVNVGGSPADMQAILDRDVQFWEKAVADAGVKLQ